MAGRLSGLLTLNHRMSGVDTPRALFTTLRTHQDTLRRKYQSGRRMLGLMFFLWAPYFIRCWRATNGHGKPSWASPWTRIGISIRISGQSFFRRSIQIPTTAIGPWRISMRLLLLTWTGYSRGETLSVPGNRSFAISPRPARSRRDRALRSLRPGSFPTDESLRGT